MLFSLAQICFSGLLDHFLVIFNNFTYFIPAFYISKNIFKSQIWIQFYCKLMIYFLNLGLLWTSTSNWQWICSCCNKCQFQRNGLIPMLCWIWFWKWKPYWRNCLYQVCILLKSDKKSSLITPFSIQKSMFVLEMILHKSLHDYILTSQKTMSISVF